MESQTVGLFEAKTHLSELVAHAEQGGEVIITRHNRPVAKIVAICGVEPFDKAKRRAAITRINALREELRLKHGALAAGEVAGWVREARDERDAQIWRNATRVKK